MRSYLQHHNIPTEQYITSRRMTIPHVIEDILNRDPGIVGFTCYDANYPYVRLLARYLKRKNPDLIIALGGPTPTFSAPLIMDHTPEIDICIQGEGEETALNLVRTHREDLHSIEGITFRHSRELITTDPRPLLSSRIKGRELDIIPSPYLTGTVPPDGTTGLLTGRGCVYPCTYCNFSAMFNHTIRYHSVSRVIKELETIAHNYDPSIKDRIMINDDIFSLNLERAKRICQAIIDRGINIPLSLETRADNCDRELIQLMKEAGITMINFGLESASPHVLKIVKKAKDEQKFLGQVKTAVTWAKEAGIKTTVSTIFGLPGEGLKEADETLQFVRDLDVHEYYHNVLFLFPGTELFSTCTQYGLDIVHSPFFLPYVTKYAYDVKKVTPLPNAGLQKQILMWKKTYADLLSYGVSRNEPFTYLVIQDMPDITEITQWLHELCGFHLSIVDMTHPARDVVESRIQLLLEGGVPIGFYSVVEGDVAEGQLTLYSHVELHTAAPEIPFSEWNPGTDELVTLEKEIDIRTLGDLITAHVNNGILTYRGDELPKLIVDACTWGNTLCPSMERGFLVIEGTAVKSCFHGVCIGRVGEDITILRNAVSSLIRRREEERGCDMCAVRRECSHCISPRGYTDEEFCTLKREYPYLSRVIPLLEWVYTYGGKSNLEMQVRLDEKAPPLFYTGELKTGDALPGVTQVTLFSYGQTPYVFTGEKSLSLDRVKAAILEACQLRVGREYLLSYLEDQGCPNSFLEDALFILETLQLVTH
ncbi:MAG: B12-binding domain-containing radical SAM protein [Theionarchaea archaeon]|nr:B12-binding domain-containing radical SAM protein [Theionarchaea archaeon]